ncbi:collagen alpha-1(XVII) chain [Sarcophilus harrisii]|uniref:collagen alpha-1(XVII) chain n=1 Tax=Sarcophilus harrisii TaxID=9305 RepID=UPI001301DA11|nr:collagen alpha-1(XVII) chain [Sarcophilus harrisii]
MEGCGEEQEEGLQALAAILEDIGDSRKSSDASSLSEEPSTSEEEEELEEQGAWEQDQKKLLELEQASQALLAELSVLEAECQIERSCRERAEEYAAQVRQENTELKRLSVLFLPSLGPEPLPIPQEQGLPSEPSLSPEQQHIRDLGAQVTELLREKKELSLQVQELQRQLKKQGSRWERPVGRAECGLANSSVFPVCPLALLSTSVCLHLLYLCPPPPWLPTAVRGTVRVVSVLLSSTLHLTPVAGWERSGSWACPGSGSPTLPPRSRRSGWSSAPCRRPWTVSKSAGEAEAGVPPGAAGVWGSLAAASPRTGPAPASRELRPQDAGGEEGGPPAERHPPAAPRPRCPAVRGPGGGGRLGHSPGGGKAPARGAGSVLGSRSGPPPAAAEGGRREELPAGGSGLCPARKREKGRDPAPGARGSASCPTPTAAPPAAALCPPAGVSAPQTPRRVMGGTGLSPGGRREGGEPEKGRQVWGRKEEPLLSPSCPPPSPLQAIRMRRAPNSQPAPAAPSLEDKKAKAVQEMMDRIRKGVVLRPAARKDPGQDRSKRRSAAVTELQTMLASKCRPLHRGSRRKKSSRKDPDGQLAAILQRRRHLLDSTLGGSQDVSGAGDRGVVPKAEFQDSKSQDQRKDWSSGDRLVLRGTAGANPRGLPGAGQMTLLPGLKSHQGTEHRFSGAPRECPPGPAAAGQASFASARVSLRTPAPSKASVLWGQPENL